MPDFGPSEIGVVLQGVGALAQAAAIGFAAWMASNTFAGWRKQKLSERRIDQAERILTATYKVRRGLSHIRNPMIWGHELQAAEDKLKAAGDWPVGRVDQDVLRTKQAYYSRLSETRVDRVELEECQPMARALFGEELEIALETLNRQANKVKTYVDANANNRRGLDPAFRQRIDAAIYEGHSVDAPNEMDETIAAQVRIIEGTLVPVLRLERG